MTPAASIQRVVLRSFTEAVSRVPGVMSCSITAQAGSLQQVSAPYSYFGGRRGIARLQQMPLYANGPNEPNNFKRTHYRTFGNFTLRIESRNNAIQRTDMHTPAVVDCGRGVRRIGAESIRPVSQLGQDCVSGDFPDIVAVSCPLDFHI
jgi:hypothetical protein